ncbi:MAG TPA: hypothetical protein GXX14_03915 [Clostridiaceae bacterium]|nr:hypothetical protein [Clostridiaceae bacterium]
MHISSMDKEVLRKLGQQYMDIAMLPVHKEKVGLWKALNRSKMQRPMVCIDQLPWNELIAKAPDELACLVEDPFFRGVEWMLRQKIYMWNHFPVDMVIEPYITIPKDVKNSGYGLTENSEVLALSEGSTAPSRHFNRVLKDYEDIEKIKDMEITVDNEMSELHFQQAKDIFEGVAPVIQGHGIQFHLGVWDYLTTLMSVEDAYIEIMDRPEFIHACMNRITEATIAGIRQANELQVHDDIANTCHCSYIYTDELLPDFGMGKGPVSKNCWAFGMAQLFTSVSPKTTEEFELPYITRMAEYFGMIYYGCCDRMDDRLDIVKKIPNVKKVSCSPWSDRKNFAEKIGDKLIMSNKPSPAYIAEDTVDWDAVKADLQYTVDLAKANNVNLEIILKDISTVRFEPERLTKWAEIAMEIVENY